MLTAMIKLPIQRKKAESHSPLTPPFFGGGGMYKLLQVQRQICIPSTMVISKCIKCDKWPLASTTITHKLH